MKAAVALVLAAWALPAPAASIESLTIAHDGPRYRMQLSARLDAPARDSFAVFQDFSNLPKINDAIEGAETLAPPAPDVRRLKTQVRVCVWLFCARLRQVQDIRESLTGDVGTMDATVLPALSNLRHGRAQWRMSPCDSGTCLQFDAELEPDFWVPPVIGPWAIERAMRREAVATAEGIERLARAAPAVRAPR